MLPVLIIGYCGYPDIPEVFYIADISCLVKYLEKFQVAKS